MRKQHRITSWDAGIVVIALAILGASIAIASLLTPVQSSIAGIIEIIFGAWALVYAHFQVNPLPPDPSQTTQPLQGAYDRSKHQFWQRIGVLLLLGVVIVLVPLARNLGIAQQHNLRPTVITGQNATSGNGRNQINETATTQAGSTTPDQLYNTVTSGTPVLTDDLTQPDKYQWDQGTSNSGSCKFTNEGYQVSTPNSNNTQDCHAEATNFSNFAFQTRFVIRSGSGAGLVFRSTVIQPGINRSYRFRIGIDGHWDLVCISCGKFATRPIIDGDDTKDIHGIGSPNTLTVIAKSSNIYLYVNDIYLNKASDDLFNTGRIGLFVVNFSPSSNTTATFYNVKVWNI